MAQKPEDDDKVRLDKWLWAARFYKTRALAKAAIESGKVHWRGERCKPGKEPRVWLCSLGWRSASARRPTQ